MGRSRAASRRDRRVHEYHRSHAARRLGDRVECELDRNQGGAHLVRVGADRLAADHAVGVLSERLQPRLRQLRPAFLQSGQRRLRHRALAAPAGIRPECRLRDSHGDYSRRLQFHTDYTQYQDYAFFGNPWPLTGLAGDFGTGNYETDQNVTSEEFRVSSASPGKRLQWL